jgi:Uncharacterised protein family (UPF0175)
MEITVSIPDDIAKRLFAEGKDPARVVLEALALEGYRSDLLSEYQIKLLLGFDTRYEVHGFLKERAVPLNYGIEELEKDLIAAREITARILAERGAARVRQP